MAKIGWAMAALLALFMIGASIAPKLLGAQVAMDAMQEIGWPSKYLLLIGAWASLWLREEGIRKVFPVSPK